MGLFRPKIRNEAPRSKLRALTTELRRCQTAPSWSAPGVLSEGYVRVFPGRDCGFVATDEEDLNIHRVCVYS
jgi:hypothetical protein